MQRGERTRLVIITAEGAHEGHVQVYVRIDTAGQHELAFRIDHLRAGRMQFVPDGLDVFAFDEDIGATREIVIHDGSTADQDGHGVCSFLAPLPLAGRG